MPDYSYYQLIQEVRTTNGYLETQNETLSNIDSNVTTMLTFVVALLVVKCSDMIHHLFDACYKKH